MSPRRNRRNAILDAAADLVRESGAAHMTLDAVSAKANVSKGGLLYHFKTKEAMLQSMVSRLIEVMASIRGKEFANLPPSPSRSLKAHVLSMEVLRQQKKVMSIATALLAASAHDPTLVKPARDDRETMITEMQAAGISPAFIRVVVCAADGLFLSEMLGLTTYSRKERQSVIDRLLRLVDEEDARLCK